MPTTLCFSLLLSLLSTNLPKALRIHVTLSLVHPQHTGLLEIAQVHLMGSTFEVYSSDHLDLVAINYDDYMRNYWVHLKLHGFT